MIRLQTLKNLPNSRKIALFLLVLAAAFLIGFLPPWLGTRALQSDLGRTRQELALVRSQTLAGAALAEATRANHERGRQLLSAYYDAMEQALPVVQDPASRLELQEILTERDEMITLLARASAESTSRLAMLYTRSFAAVAPGKYVPPPGPSALPRPAPSPAAGPADPLVPQP